jgi:hypothetical protein
MSITQQSGDFVDLKATVCDQTRKGISWVSAINQEQTQRNRERAMRMATPSGSVVIVVNRAVL